MGDLTPTMLRLSTDIEFFRVALLQRLAAGFDFSSVILGDLLAICGDVSCFATHSSVTNFSRDTYRPLVFVQSFSADCGYQQRSFSTVSKEPSPIA